MTDNYGSGPSDFDPPQYGGQPGQMPPAQQPGQMPPAQQPGQMPPAQAPQQMPPGQGQQNYQMAQHDSVGLVPPGVENKKVIAGICGILFGWLGVHKFILGYNTAGAIQLAVGVLTCGIGGILGIVEGIIYLTKSDEEFYQTYQVGQKEWF